MFWSSRSIAGIFQLRDTPVLGRSTPDTGKYNDEQAYCCYPSTFPDGDMREKTIVFQSTQFP
ncbi:MAG TPA: hypothetical protein VGB38_03240 [bacterium]